MDVTVRVMRLDPDAADPTPFWQEFPVTIEDNATVLDALIKIREETDGTLSLRCSCRSSICGSCAMRINGHAALACKTQAVNARGDNNTITVEPAGNMPVVKDLVVEFDTFWDKVRAVRPWLQPQGPEPEPNEEYIASSESMGDLADVMACIMCGACVSDCTVLAVDSTFLGPAALAKAYRFVADPRDDADAERLGELNESGGIWDCTRCMQCVEVCPKDVDPMGRIMVLRDKAMEAGYTNTYGARHANAFADSVKHSGWLDELRLPIKTFGMFNMVAMLRLIPIGIRSQLVGKRPPIFHKSIPGADSVRRLFDKVGGKR